MAINYFPYKKWSIWDFPGSPVVKTLPSNEGGVDLIPGWRASIPHAFSDKKTKHKTKVIL